MSDAGTTGGGKDFKAEVDALVEGAQGLFGTLKEIFDKSRDEIARASRLGKTRIDLFQLDKDREHALRELGEVALRLVRDGAIAHPDLLAGRAKLEEIAQRRKRFEDEVEEIARAQAEAKAAEAAEAANDAGPAANAGPAAADAGPPAGEAGPATTGDDAATVGPAADAGRAEADAAGVGDEAAAVPTKGKRKGKGGGKDL